MKKILLLFCVLLVGCSNKNVTIKEEENLMKNIISMEKEEIEKYADENKLKLEWKEEYSNEPYQKVLSQSIKEGSEIKENDSLIVTISKGRLAEEVYKEHNVNELGSVPIMMYHGIHNKKNEETKYTGGNVDKDGYQRTAEAFRQDLEFYYKSGYRMIRLDDYVDGKIDVPLGYSPIILTFDDGLENNIKVTGLDENGDIIIDPNSAVGILEEFKKKYEDYQVTATFFVNGSLFNQEEYNEKILHWMVENGYDIGNHSYSHADFTKISNDKSVEEIGKVYKQLDSIIKGKYVSIVALPFGSPYSKKHSNFDSILSGTYDGFSYETKSTLRVGWESNDSPFSKDFDPLFLKRIRAYDNEGKEFDIEQNFQILEKKRYISDGSIYNVVVSDENKENVNSKDLQIITY